MGRIRDTTTFEVQVNLLFTKKTIINNITTSITNPPQDIYGLISLVLQNR